MKKLVSSVASGAVMAVFLVLAWSCVEERDELAPCDKFETPIEKSQDVFIKIMDRKSKKPIPFALVRYHVNDIAISPGGVGGTCIKLFYKDQQNIDTGVEGIFYDQHKRTYNYKDEYTILTCNIESNGYYSESFELRLKPNDNGVRKDIYLLQIDVRP